MTESFSILVVCLGNVCRSPLAAALLRMRFAELGAPDVRVSSAGVTALVGYPMDESAAVELRRLGGSATGFASRQVTGPMVLGADLVLTATKDLRSRLLQETPRALRRTFTIRELGALLALPTMGETSDVATLVARAASLKPSVQNGDYDVPDPIGRSQQVHREVADLLDVHCSALAGRLAAD